MFKRECAAYHTLGKPACLLYAVVSRRVDGVCCCALLSLLFVFEFLKQPA